MAKKALIGIVTSDLKKYCFGKLVEAIRKQTFQDFDVLFVDNSDGDYDKFIESKGFRVIKDLPKDTRINSIISGRNIIRNEFLKGEYEYLLFLDSDIIPPQNAIEKLLSNKKDVISGIALVAKHINRKPYALPCIYQIIEGKGFRQFSLKEVMGDKVVEADIVGFGCCLIHKDVIKDIEIRQEGGAKTGGEDFAFSIDAKKAGFKIYADTSVKCFHMHYPENDPRHSFHKFETHIKKPKHPVSYSINMDGFEIN